VFPEGERFVHHRPLPPTPQFGDEGAANHTRLCWGYGARGLELYTYGRGTDADPSPARYPARQTRAASEAVARLHGLKPGRAYFVQQNPAVIDNGVFHNDVIAVGNREVLMYHEHAYLHTAAMREWIAARLEGAEPVFVKVASSQVSVEEAVRSYLFNSQLVTAPDGTMRLIAAQECSEIQPVADMLKEIVADASNPISKVHTFDLRQSMNNGGGPACLRLRVVLTPDERAAVNSECWLTDRKYVELRGWVEKYYRDRLTLDDLADPLLLEQSRYALDELTRILRLGHIYDFQS
jgi:succinylarginine dihydrolase